MVPWYKRAYIKLALKIFSINAMHSIVSFGRLLRAQLYHSSPITYIYSTKCSYFQYTHSISSTLLKSAPRMQQLYQFPEWTDACNKCVELKFRLCIGVCCAMQWIRIFGKGITNENQERCMCCIWKSFSYLATPQCVEYKATNYTLFVYFLFWCILSMDACVCVLR